MSCIKALMYVLKDSILKIILNLICNSVMPLTDFHIKDLCLYTAGRLFFLQIKRWIRWLLVSFYSTASLQVDFLYQQLLSVAAPPDYAFSSMLHFSQPLPPSTLHFTPCASHFLPEQLPPFPSLPRLPVLDVYISASLIIVPSETISKGVQERKTELYLSSFPTGNISSPHYCRKVIK